MTNYDITCQCQHSCSHQDVVYNSLTAVTPLIRFFAFAWFAYFGSVMYVALWMTLPFYTAAGTIVVVALLVRRFRARRRMRRAVDEAYQAEWAAYQVELAEYHRQEALHRAKEAPWSVYEDDERLWDKELAEKQ